jgi:hypothetical protein
VSRAAALHATAMRNRARAFARNLRNIKNPYGIDVFTHIANSIPISRAW